MPMSTARQSQITLHVSHQVIEWPAYYENPDSYSVNRGRNEDISPYGNQRKVARDFSIWKFETSTSSNLEPGETFAQSAEK